MNDFEMKANVYRSEAKKGNISNEVAEKQCKVLDYLAKCDQEDLLNIFDNSFFHNMAIAYLYSALASLKDQDVLNENQTAAVREEIQFQLEKKTPDEIIKKFNFFS